MIQKKRGWRHTSYGAFPIVYLRGARKTLNKTAGFSELTDEEKKDLLDREAAKAYSKKTQNDTPTDEAGGSLDGLPWDITSDGQQLILTFDGHKTFHRDPGNLALYLSRKFVVARIKDAGVITTLRELRDITESSFKKIKEMINEVC